MKALVVCSILVSCMIATISSDGITSEELLEAQIALRRLMIAEDDLIPEFVRMIFHDCVGPEGCNGCLDKNTKANGGLEEAIDLSISLRARLTPQLSQADFNVLVGTEATKLAIIKASKGKKKKGKIEIPFFIGRKDCNVVKPDLQLPPGQTLETVKFFFDQFRMTPRESVAIMGGHSLGHMHKEHSGFDGHWDNSETKLDNKYFKNMVKKNYGMKLANISKTANSTQWHKGELTMLLSDAILLKDYTVTGEADTPTCSYRKCPEQMETGPIVREYAKKQDVFQRDFVSAFLKMVSKAPGATLTLVEQLEMPKIKASGEKSSQLKSGEILGEEEEEDDLLEEDK